MGRTECSRVVNFVGQPWLVGQLVYVRIHLHDEPDNPSLMVEKANRILRPNGKITQRLISLA